VRSGVAVEKHDGRPRPAVTHVKPGSGTDVNPIQCKAVEDHVSDATEHSVPGRTRRPLDIRLLRHVMRNVYPPRGSACGTLNDTRRVPPLCSLAIRSTSGSRDDKDDGGGGGNEAGRLDALDSFVENDGGQRHRDGGV
jgi:hypothetical protein